MREALRFSAYLRQPEHVSIQEKDDYVEDIIELLELQDLADGMIGFPSVFPFSLLFHLNAPR